MSHNGISLDDNDSDDSEEQQEHDGSEHDHGDTENDGHEDENDVAAEEEEDTKDDESNHETENAFDEDDDAEHDDEDEEDILSNIQHEDEDAEHEPNHETEHDGAQDDVESDAESDEKGIESALPDYTKERVSVGVVSEESPGPGYYIDSQMFVNDTIPRDRKKLHPKRVNKMLADKRLAAHALLADMMCFYLPKTQLQYAILWGTCPRDISFPDAATNGLILQYCNTFQSPPSSDDTASGVKFENTNRDEFYPIDNEAHRIDTWPAAQDHAYYRVIRIHMYRAKRDRRAGPFKFAKENEKEKKDATVWLRCLHVERDDLVDTIPPTKIRVTAKQGVSITQFDLYVGGAAALSPDVLFFVELPPSVDIRVYFGLLTL